MKRILSITLLVSLVISVAGPYPLYKFLQYRTRREVKTQIGNQIAPDELKQLVFPRSAEITWLEDGKELMHQGELYDVVKKENQNGRVILHCIDDKQESRLFTKMDEWVRKRLDNDRDNAGQSARMLVKIMTLQYLVKQPYHIQLTTGFSELSSPYCFSAITTLGDPESPPPDLA
ncbi:MAG: hypothetical protein H6585_10315 [Flavobacteriales bacterium]|nr:hypothetical protein [Flavobacteriales bacterium]MCB9448725.1 hypothetical protein [Flavobacteriales bacterium]